MTKNISRGSKPGGTASANGPAKSDAKWTAPALIDNPLEAVAVESTLTDKEQKDLVKLEKVIRAGWQTFVEVGTALAEVRDRRLYRDKYGDSFENYCREELGFSRPYAYNLIGSAEVNRQMSSIEDIEIKPINEAQCRELIPVPAEKRPEAWKKVITLAGDKPLTAKLVHQAVAEFKPKNKKTKTKPTAITKPKGIAAALKLLDEIEELAEDADKKLKTKLTKLRAVINNIS